MTTVTVKNKSKPELIVEKADGEFWGRVKINGTLIYDYAKSLDALINKIKRLVRDFEGVQVDDFEVSYDLTTFFEAYPFLNTSEFAKLAGISPALMRQYTSGSKSPSEERVKQIKEAVKRAGKELMSAKVHKTRRTHTAA